jgi:hypothetical protein
MNARRTAVQLGSCCIGALVGILGMQACSPGDECECPLPRAIEQGAFAVTAIDSNAGAPPAFDGVEDVRLSIRAERVLIEYTQNGVRGTAVYDVTTKY